MNGTCFGVSSATALRPDGSADVGLWVHTADADTAPVLLIVSLTNDQRRRLIAKLGGTDRD